MTQQGKTFRSTVDDSTLFAPIVTTGGAQHHGIPIFVNADTGQPEPFDPWNLKASKRIASTVMGVLGEKGHGKTTFNIVMALRLQARMAGLRRMSVAINDMRRNDARPEYGKLCAYLGISEIPLGRHRLNFLDPDLGLSSAEQLELLTNSLEYALQRRLETIEIKALRYGLKKMSERFAGKEQLALLMASLRRLTQEDELRFQAQIEQAMYTASNDPEIASFLAEEIRPTPGLLDSAVQLSNAIENLLDGQYGAMFGGSHSLASVLHDNDGLAVFDYSVLSSEATTQMLAAMWLVKTAAMQRGDHRLFFDVEIHDENYTLWRHLVYARAMHKLLKQVRATSTFIILNTHRLADYQTVGSTDSEQYKLATSMIDDIDMWLLGKHTPGAAEDTARRLELTREEQARLLKLDYGVWGLKIGTEPVRWVTIDLTEVEAEVTFSDDANESMAVTRTRR
jgi:hypothetical protein